MIVCGGVACKLSRKHRYARLLLMLMRGGVACKLSCELRHARLLLMLTSMVV
jgi:hypothetical protein